MNFTYKTLLSLDSIVKFLSQAERIIIIKLMLNYERDHTDKIASALRLINKHKWEPPKFNVGQDRITRFYNENTERWELLEKYDHPIINEIQKLK